MTEISRHYRADHGYGNRQSVPYHLCAIVSEAAASQLVSQARLASAKRKNGHAEKPATAPRYPNWMPGGGRAAYLAAIGGGAASAPTPTNSTSGMGRSAEDRSSTSPEPTETESNTAQPPNTVASTDAESAEGGPSALDELLKIPSVRFHFDGYELGSYNSLQSDQPTAPTRPVQTFGDWDRDEDGNQHAVSSDESSSSEDSSYE